MSPEKPVIAASASEAEDLQPDSPAVVRRLGFMEGELSVPDDFDQMYAEEIRALFEDGPLFPDET